MITRLLNNTLRRADNQLAHFSQIQRAFGKKSTPSNVEIVKTNKNPLAPSPSPVSKFLCALQNPQASNQLDRVLPNPNILSSLRSPSCFSIEGKKLDTVTVFYETQTNDGLNRYQEVAKIISYAQNKQNQGDTLTAFERVIAQAELVNMTAVGGGGQIKFNINAFKQLLEINTKELPLLTSSEDSLNSDSSD